MSATRLTLLAAAITLTLASGKWLSRSGRPYGDAPFNIHKLVALGAVVGTVWQLSRELKKAECVALTGFLLVLAGLCVIALFATGALISLNRFDYALMRGLHQVAAVLCVVAMVLVVYLLRRDARAEKSAIMCGESVVAERAQGGQPGQVEGRCGPTGG